MKRLNRQFSQNKSFLFTVCAMLINIAITHGQLSIKGDIGVGGGLSYGGFGAQVSLSPIEQLGLFGGVGYNLDAVGYNIGLKYKVVTPAKVHPYLTAMYGYNTVLMIEGAAVDSKTTYFGFSTGAGIEFRLREKSFFAAEVLVPFRPQAFKDAVDDLKSIDYTIKDRTPVTICIGYHFKF